MEKLNACRNGHKAGIRQVDKKKWIVDCCGEDCAERRVYGKTLDEAFDKWNRRTPNA